MTFLKTFKTLKPETLQNLFILFITGLLFWISLTTLLPTLPTYIEDLGGTKQQVGTVMGCFAIGLLASRTWLGNIADRRSRKIVVLIGTIVAALAPLGYMAVQSISTLIVAVLMPLGDTAVQSISTLTVIRAFHGISIAAFTTGYSILVVDLSPPKQRGEIIGYMSLAIPIGMGIGPALGSYLQESLGYTPLFLVSATSGFLAFLLASQVQETRPETVLKAEVEKKAVRQQNFRQILIHPALWGITLILFLIGMLFGGLIAFLPLFLRQSPLNFSAGLFYTYAAISSFIARILTSKASDLYGRGLFITGSLVCYGASMLLLTSATTEMELMLAAILEGIGGGILVPMLIVLISDRSYTHERGRVYAICIGGFDVGMALIGPILGVFNFSYRVMFATTASFAFLALLIFLTQSNKNLIYSLRFAFGLERDRYALDDR